MDEFDNYLKSQNENLQINRNCFYNFEEPNHNQNLYSQIFSHPCCCHFHCQYCNHCHHSIHRNISFSKISHINPTISDSSLNFNYSPTNNNSLIYLNNEENNLFNKPKKLQDSKNKNLNRAKTTKKYLLKKNLKRSETEGNYFRRNKLKNKFIYNHDIKKKNLGKKDKSSIDKKNSEIQPMNSSEIKRKKLAQYYHIINLKKYSYGGDQLEIVNESNNHIYKEIKGTSSNKSLSNNFKDKNKFNIYNKDKLKIEISDNNNSNFTTNNNTSIINNNIEKDNSNYSYNFNYNDYPFKTSQNSPKYSNKNVLNEGFKSSKILKETYNTRFVDLKYLKKSPSQLYLYKANEDIIFNNNKKEENIKKDIPKNNEDINLRKGKNDFVYLKTYDSNLKNEDNKINKHNLNQRYENNNHYSMNSYQSNKINSNKYKYKYSNLYDLKTNLKNKYNIQNDNRDYNSKKDKSEKYSINQRVTSESSKKINDDKKRDNNIIFKNKKYLEKFLTTNNQASQYINDSNINSKKKNSLEEKEIKNEKNNEINRNNLNNGQNNNQNKILYNIIKDIKDKSTEHNKIIIRSKSKIWKP